MSIFIELISYSGSLVVGAMMGSLASKLKRKKKPKECLFGSVPWSYDSGFSGFICCRSTNVHLNKKQPRYCECPLFPRGHFHFVCEDCQFSVIMRCYDDQEGA